MDVDSTPRVTIEGGPGWQVDGPPPDVIGTDRGADPRWRPSRALVTAVVLSALLGFAAATALAERRHDRAGEIDAATLSVSAWGTGQDPDPVTVRAGRPTIRIPVMLANTGPRAIELLSVQLMGTAVRTEDLEARRLAPGSQGRVYLVRPLDCTGVPRAAGPDDGVVPLAVRARTDAGEREVEVRASLNTGMLSRQVVIGLCGDLPPDEALMTDLTDQTVDGDVALLSMQVTNGSRHRFTVERVRAMVPGLSARFVDDAGRAVPLPFPLPAGDFSTPRQPWEAGESTTWRVEVTLADCRALPSSAPSDSELQLLGVDVDTGERSATVQIGGDPYDLMRELARSACPS